MQTESDTRKRARLEARIPASHKAMLQRAAILQGQSLSEFLVASATKEARQVIREHEILELTERDQLAFAQALLDPAPANERLERAARDYRDAQ